MRRNSKVTFGVDFLPKPEVEVEVEVEIEEEGMSLDWRGSGWGASYISYNHKMDLVVWKVSR